MKTADYPPNWKQISQTRRRKREAATGQLSFLEDAS